VGRDEVTDSKTRKVWLRRALAFGGALAGAGVAAYLLADRMLSAPSYVGPDSEHFAGGRFRNPGPDERHGFLDFIRWRLTSRPGAWKEWTDSPPGDTPPRAVGGGRLRVTFVGHATVLVQMDGLNILTDPVWSERASPLTWAGPKRARPPGIRFEDLPPIDVVLISHNHYDHLDVSTLRRLRDEHRPRFIVPLGNGALLESEGVEGATELDWWQDTNVGEGVRAVCVPAKHFSGRGLRDRDRTLWCGYVIEGPSGAVYFAGDTAAGSHFAEVRERFGGVRLALLPIGAFLPRWFMRPVHVSPEEAVAAHETLGAVTSVAIHFGTFPLGDDGETEAVEGLGRALTNRGVSPEEFRVPDFGVGFDAPPAQREGTPSALEDSSKS
jgi:L-ascorbate metabolism protein UlaG (beta-lactamase superfamily)